MKNRVFLGVFPDSPRHTRAHLAAHQCAAAHSLDTTDVHKRHAIIKQESRERARKRRKMLANVRRFIIYFIEEKKNEKNQH